MYFIAGLTDSSRSDEDLVKTLLLAYGENSVHIAVWKCFSGRKYMPEGPDSLLPGPLWAPLVRYKLGPEHRSHNHFRPGNHWCGPPLSILYLFTYGSLDYALFCATIIIDFYINMPL